jgi:hypothetical protein
MRETIQHITDGVDTVDGFIEINCRCRWNFVGPDYETAVDAFGEHCYEVGFRDGQEDIAANVREHGAP